MGLSDAQRQTSEFGFMSRLDAQKADEHRAEGVRWLRESICAQHPDAKHTYWVRACEELILADMFDAFTGLYRHEEEEMSHVA